VRVGEREGEREGGREGGATSKTSTPNPFSTLNPEL